MTLIRIIPLCALFLASTACAQTKFGIKPLNVLGDLDFQATSVNASGVIVGTAYFAATGGYSGAIIDHDQGKFLPPPQAFWGEFNPRAINAQGAILGWAKNRRTGESDMFLLQGSGYNKAFQQKVIDTPKQSDAVPLPMALTDGLNVSFNTLVRLDGTLIASFGQPPALMQVPAFGAITQINSVTDSGMVAGVSTESSGATKAYLGLGTTYTPLLPAGATQSAGGYVNEAGMVAGSYEDAKGGWHGFTYANGAYTLFDMPQAASAVAVDAINAAGRVVGSYTDAGDGRQHAFLWNGAVVSSFGDYRSDAGVTLAINSKGVMVLSAAVMGNHLRYSSWRVLCAGSGC